MRCLVTGAAGFIGSHLARHLLVDGHDVVALDCLRDTYPSDRKRANRAWVAEAASAPDAGALSVDERDLAEAPLGDLLGPGTVVFHLAGRPGVRDSWGDHVAAHARDNIVATERLLAASVAAGVDRFVHASSSSIYGEAVRYPCHEDDLPRPHSPYGVTKLAGEHLALAHARNEGLPVVALRYFSVYGPRQRPDMGLSRLFEAARSGSPFPRYGDGSQVRDLTFVGDVVSATVAAATVALDGPVVANVAGGTQVSLAELIERVEGVTGRRVTVDERPAQPGDVSRTGGDTTRAREVLGWTPSTGLDHGLAAMAAWSD